MRRRRDRGAAAVEFALVIPVLLLLILGMMEFSRLFNFQISLSNAARSAARVMAIGNDQTDAINAAIAASPSLSPPISGSDISFSPAACDAGLVMTVQISYNVTLITDWFMPTIGMSGEAATPCGG